jgi:isochorismate pyruvate lyase
MTEYKIQDLSLLRAEIDAIDKELLALVAQRFRVVRHVVQTKKHLKLPATIPARVDEVINNAKANAVPLGISPESVERLWKVLVAETIRFEEKSGVAA